MASWKSMFAAVMGLAIVGGTLAGTVGQSSAAGLDGKTIRAIFPGQFEAKVQGYRVQFAGYSNGKLTGEAYGQQDRGRWFVKGNSLCVSWTEWTKGKAKCGVISQKGGWFVASNGQGEVLKFRRSMVAQQ